ncbi:MAG: pyruvate kinase [Candidatus Vogelbacteria bacterium]|nr:pyruvate kinase [Candidatus Vogelbacteria bacterium]
MYRKKTKIVATVGPVTANEKTMTELVKAGMNVVRINFSHGDFAEHEPKVHLARKISQKLNKPIAILQDLGGPKIRIGDFGVESVILKPGAIFTLTTEKVVGDDQHVSINYPLLPKEVKIGGQILLHDGKKKLEIIDIKGKAVICKVIVGGEIKSRRGVNLPGAYLSISSITDKDRKDLEFGLKHKVDYIALSFVRRPSDIIELRSILQKNKSTAGIIAKIETPEALENIDEIINLADGIMVARGDLAIEIPAEEVPLVQKELIKKCNRAGKPVITATQMLESMIKSPVPTRAEVSDVANAILDGTDAIMLSEETTLGDYPVESVKMMNAIACRVERELLHRANQFKEFNHSVAGVVSRAVVQAASEVGAKVIVALTNTGHTARMISRYRPKESVIALTPNQVAVGRMMLSYGCYPMNIKKFKTLNEVLSLIRSLVLTNKLANKGDKVVVVAGMPFGHSIDTNMLLVEEI